MLVTGTRPPGRSIATAYGLGVLVFLPVPLLAQLLVLPAVAYLAFFGWVVPAALVERTGIRIELPAVAAAGACRLHPRRRRSRHAGDRVLRRPPDAAFLLRSGGESTERVAALLADLVLSPMLFVGSAILYLDQAARVRMRSSKLEAPTQEA